MKLDFAQVKNTLARNAAGGLCADDSRVKDRTNEAIGRLLPQGDWVGTVAKVNLCVANSCISLPSVFDTLIGFRVISCDNNCCFSPGYLHSIAYEFVDNGPNVCCDRDCYTGHGSDKGYAPTFYDICGTKYIRVYADVTEATGTKLLVKGYDENNNRVRSFVDGEWIDGVYINIIAPGPTDSVIKFTKVVALIKPQTRGFVRVYQLDPDTAEQSLLAILEDWEISPQYRRYHISGLNKLADNCDSGTVTVQALLKYAYRPIVNDNDELLIQSLGALKHMCKALEFEEQDLFEKAQQYEAKAILLLNQQLRNYVGKGTIQRIRLVHALSPGTIRQTR